MRIRLAEQSCQLSAVSCQENPGAREARALKAQSSKLTATRKGFTLIELLVVIAIIGILASIILASLNTAKAKGNDAKRISDIKQIQLALELYNDANNGYPAVSAESNVTSLSSSLTPADISAIPSDPTNSGSYIYQYESTDGSGNACTTGPCAGYVLLANLQTNAATGITASPPIPSGLVSACTPGSSAPYGYCQTN